MPVAGTALLLASFVTFGDLLKAVRRQARLTQRELSIAVGYSESQISRLENNERPPDLPTVAGLFLPALGLENEPLVAARLLELAAAARGEALPSQVTVEHTRRQEFAEARPLPGHPARGRMAVPPNSFVGRAAELSAVAHALAAARLITLTGAGGSGKTRLAQHAAADAASTFPDGLWWVDLAPLPDPARLLDTVAAVLGLRTSPGSSLLEQLTAALAARRLLLVLDNCEHVLAASAELAEAVLAHCPGVRVLATSRESLNIAGELLVPVPPLSLPAAPAGPPERLLDSGAVRLFVERVRVAEPSFALTADNAAPVLEICTRLDGMPLAIELAAARARVLPVAAIAARLQHRFDLLTGGRRTALPRQQSLRAALDWSYELLTAPERAVLAVLGVFVGAFSLEAVEAVTAAARPAASLADFASLANKSLVVVDHVPGAAAPYRLLETVRHYALERLEAGPAPRAVRHAHLQHYLALAEQADRRLRGPEQAVWFERLARELDNCRAALAFALETDHDAAVRLLAALDYFWQVRGFGQESHAWLRKFAQLPDLPRTPAGIVVRAWLAGLATDSAGSASRFAAALQLARAQGDQAVLAEVLFIQGQAHWWAEPSVGRALTEESLALFRAAQDWWKTAWVLAELGEFVQVRLEDRGAARACFEASLEHWRALGDQRGMAKALVHLGDIAMEQGDLDATRACCAEGLLYAEALGDLEGEAWALNGLGIAAMGEGDFDLAVQLGAQSLALSQGYANGLHVGIRRYWLAASLWRRGDLAAAEQLHDQNLAESRSLSFDWGIAVSLYGLGEVSRTRAAWKDAARWHTAALRHMRGMSARSALLAYGLDAHAALAAAVGRHAAAAQLLGAAQDMRSAVAAGLLPVEAAERAALVESVRRGLGDQAFAREIDAGRFLTVDDALALALAVTGPPPASEGGSP